MKTHRLAALLLFVVPAAGCGARSGTLGGPCDGDVAGIGECVAPAADPCGPPQLVSPVCDAAAHRFVCPAGAHPYARAQEAPATCLPFSDPAGPIRSLGGSLVRVPTDDGRCLWVAEQVETSEGATVRNVAFEPDLTAPFGTCPTQASLVGGEPASIVAMDGGDQPGFFVQLAAPFRFAGQTRIVYRLFQADSTSPVGVDSVGGGLAWWDQASGRIVVPAAGSLQFGTGLDLGDAALVTPDFAFVWGCPKPDGLTPDCIVTRFDAQGTMSLFAGAAGWTSSQNGSDGATVFSSGPWISSVLSDPSGNGLLHVFVEGFGSSLDTHTAPAPEGPWAPGSSLGPCALPGEDTHSFCVGPVVHPELADPSRPGEIAVTYGVGTTDPDGGTLTSAHPDRYWSRLVWLPVP